MGLKSILKQKLSHDQLLNECLEVMSEMQLFKVALKYNLVDAAPDPLVHEDQIIQVAALAVSKKILSLRSAAKWIKIECGREITGQGIKWIIDKDYNHFINGNNIDPKDILSEYYLSRYFHTYAVNIIDSALESKSFIHPKEIIDYIEANKNILLEKEILTDYLNKFEINYIGDGWYMRPNDDDLNDTFVRTVAKILYAHEPNNIQDIKKGFEKIIRTKKRSKIIRNKLWDIPPKDILLSALKKNSLFVVSNEDEVIFSRNIGNILDSNLIGRKIKYLREKKGLSQKEITTKLQTKNKAYISHVENGKIIPTEEKLNEFALILQEKVDWLLSDEQDIEFPTNRVEEALGISEREASILKIMKDKANGVTTVNEISSKLNIKRGPIEGAIFSSYPWIKKFASGVYGIAGTKPKKINGH